MEEIFDNKNKFPTLLIQNIYQVNYTDAIGLSLDISTTEGDLSNHLIDKLRTDKFIKFITGKQGDEFISWNKSELQNFKGDQVFSKKTYSDGVTYQLVNHIFCHDKILTITYFAISSSDKNSNLLFNKNILLFNELFHRTQIL